MKRDKLISNNADVETGERLPFTVLIDGPNFINRLGDHGISKDDIKKLDYWQMANNLQDRLRVMGMGESLFKGIEFYYSNMPQLGCLKGGEKTAFIKRLKKCPGVTVHPVKLSYLGGDREKALDTSIIVRMYEILISSNHELETIVLISSDKDFIPPLQSLRRLGKYIISVGYRDKSHNIELINHSYQFIPTPTILVSTMLK